MTTTEARSGTTIETPKAASVDMKLEIVVIPVSDVDRAKRFYGDLDGGLTLISPTETTFG